MDKIVAYIRDHKMIEPSSKILVALSGGADSVALLHKLIEEGYTCEAAHVNFKLRGDDSTMDARFCHELCTSLNISLHYLEQDANAYSKEHHLSIEMAARDIRYDYFHRILEAHKLDVVAVAHHKNDQAETILMNLVRGTGVSGMKGMRPINGKIIRPMLSMSREEVMSYISDHQLSYCSDKSNEDTKFQRNKIRHDILPHIQELNPSFIEHIGALSDRFAEANSIIKLFIKNWIKTEMVDLQRIPVDKLFRSNTPLTLLHGILKPYDFTSATIQEIYHGYPFQTGSRFFSDTHYLLADRGMLIIESLKDTQNALPETEVYPTNLSEVQLYIDILKRSEMEGLPTESHIACLDADLLTLPLHIRTWKEGDRFRPLGMKGFKKLSDFLIDQKISLADKQSVMVITSGEDIVWIVGHRIDDRFKITKDTKKLLWIELQDEF